MLDEGYPLKELTGVVSLVNSGQLWLRSPQLCQDYFRATVRACSSKGQIVILGRIVSASGQIFRSDFRPQDEIFRPRMPFRPLDEQALCDKKVS